MTTPSPPVIPLLQRRLGECHEPKCVCVCVICEEQIITERGIGNRKEGNFLCNKELTTDGVKQVSPILTKKYSRSLSI